MRALLKFIVCIFVLLAFLGCEDDSKNTAESNESVPFDVPISQIDANVSIDEKLPPEPAIEGEEKKEGGIEIGGQ